MSSFNKTFDGQPIELTAKRSAAGPIDISGATANADAAEPQPKRDTLGSYPPERGEIPCES
jgi:hypothetical protein